MGDILENLSVEELRTLVKMYARNMYALDGVWFQSVESRHGMNYAMQHNCAAWERFTRTEARRIKNFLKLPEEAGLDGLERALPLRFSAQAHPSVEWIRKEDELIYRVNECRVQSARKSKGMPYHPCAPAGLIEHAGFASVIDNRIVTRQVSCYPDVTDETCACCWKFTLE